MSASRTFRSTQFGALGAVPQSLGIPAAAFPGRVATNSDLMVAVDRQQTRLAAALNSSDTSMTVANPAIIGAFNLLSIDDELVKTTAAPTGNVVPISRGFDGTTPAVHLAGALVSGMVDAWHHNALAAEVEAIEGALGPNLSALPLSPIVAVTPYKFAPQTPGGTLAPGNQVITLAPVPKGVNGTDKNHYLYISGGAGTAEAVLITGGTAVSGAPSGTVIVNCANAHSGAWTIQSASAGIYEAYIANPWRKLYMPAGRYIMYATLNFETVTSLILIGDGYDYANNSGTMLDFAAVTSGPGISLNNNSGAGTLQVMKLQEFGIAGTFNTTGGNGIVINKANRVCISGVQVIGFAGDGILIQEGLEIFIQDQTHVLYSGGWGIHIIGTDLTGFIVIRDSYINWNSRSDSHGNIGIFGTGGASPLLGVITLMNVDAEQAGQQPFPSVTITTAYALFVGWVSNLCVMNCDFEVGAGTTLVSYAPFSSTISNLTEFNNAFVGNQIVYGPTITNVKSWGNKYYGATCFRTFQASNRSNYDIGPDAAGDNSPEPVNHPRLLGLPGSTGAGAALLGANSPATVLTAPFTWLKQQGPTGETLFIPAWK